MAEAVQPAQAETQAATPHPFQQLLSQPAAPGLPPPSAVVIGTLRSCGGDGGPRVQWPGGPDQPVPAASLVSLAQEDAGRCVALSFPGGLIQPLILGLVWPAGSTTSQPTVLPVPVAVEVGGSSLEIASRQTLTLRCGEASLTLTADGQVLIRGHYISSHSTGTQRIKGAAVRIN